MAIRLQGGFTSRKQESVYRFNIHDSSYSGGIIDFDLAKSGMIEEYDQEDKGRNQSILTSSMSISMIVDNSDIETFIEDVANAAEGRFLLEVLKDDNKYWYGYVLPDQFTLNDLPFGNNPVLKIRATDGIGRLKEIDYNNNGVSYSGKASFLDHLFNVLGKISLTSFYGATEDYLITYVDWWDQNHVYSITEDPYDYSRFDHRALLEIDESGEVVYASAYDVLEQIVKSWNCRFFFSEGTYKLVQVNAYKTDSETKVLKVYDKNKGLSTVSTSDFSIWNRSTGLLVDFNKGARDCFHNDGNYKYYPALRETQVEYEHFSTDNLIPGETWTQGTNQTATYNDIDFNNGIAFLNFSALVSYRADWNPASDLEVITYWFQIRIKVGSYYLKRDFTVSNGKITPGAVEWTQTLSYYNYFPETYIYSDDFTYSDVINFPTPKLKEGGQLDVNINRAGAYNSSGQQVFTVSSNFTPYYTFSNVSVRLLVDGNLQDQTNIKVYNATNDNGSTNSKKETVKLLVGDGPNASTFGAIEVYDSSDQEWVSSSGWRKGNSGTYRDFGQLLANEILAGQKVAIRRYFGNVTGDYIAHGRLRRHGGATIRNYVFIGGRHNLHEDRWTGEWFVIDVDNTGITSETPRNFNNIIPPFQKEPPFSDTFKDLFDNINEPPVVTHDSNSSSPVHIGIDGPITRGVKITSIPTGLIESDGYIYADDEVIISTPSGEQIPVKVVSDVMAGDTSISIVPITPSIDIPNGSTVGVQTSSSTAISQEIRKKQSCFNFLSTVIDGDPIHFFRIDEDSELYYNKVVELELQVFTPGTGSGTYDFEFKINNNNEITTTLSETTELHRVTTSTILTRGSYSFHISNITGTVPSGIKVCMKYITPQSKLISINSSSTISIEYSSQENAFADGVRTNRLYALSIDNIYGMPQGLVVRNYSTVGFPSDALAGVDDDEWYSVSIPNEYAVFVSAVRSKNYSGTAYVDDAAAATGGIEIDSPYVLAAGNLYGLPAGFVKLRKS